MLPPVKDIIPTLVPCRAGGGRWPRTIPTRWHENIVLRACSKTLIFWSNMIQQIFQVWKSLRTWVVALKHLGTMPSCIILVLSWPVLSDLYSCWTACPNEIRRVYCSLKERTKYMHHFVERFLLLACSFLLHDVKVLKVHLSCWKHWQKVTTPKSSSNSTLVLFLLTPWIILPAFLLFSALGLPAKSQDCCTLPRKPLVLILGRLLWHDIACSEGGHVILCESIGKIFRHC